MSAVKAKNTRLETEFFSLLRKQGVYFQIHYKKAYGNPDIAFPAKKIAVFLDSDFWHGWRYPTWSRKLTSHFWNEKIERNRKRDRQVARKLRGGGWIVLRIWEHQIQKSPEACVKRIVDLINKN